MGNKRVKECTNHRQMHISTHTHTDRRITWKLNANLELKLIPQRSDNLQIQLWLALNWVGITFTGATCTGKAQSTTAAHLPSVHNQQRLTCHCTGMAQPTTTVHLPPVHVWHNQQRLTCHWHLYRYGTINDNGSLATCTGTAQSTTAHLPLTRVHVWHNQQWLTYVRRHK